MIVMNQWQYAVSLRLVSGGRTSGNGSIVQHQIETYMKHFQKRYFEVFGFQGIYF